jgi:hypothetical protein
MSDKGLKSIVADLHDLGYTGSDIARAVGRSPQRINCILRELGLTAPPFQSLDDLPHDMRTRIQLWMFQTETRGTADAVGSP